MPEPLPDLQGCGISLAAGTVPVVERDIWTGGQEQSTAWARGLRSPLYAGEEGRVPPAPALPQTIDHLLALRWYRTVSLVCWQHRETRCLSLATPYSVPMGSLRDGIENFLLLPSLLFLLQQDPELGAEPCSQLL